MSGYFRQFSKPVEGATLRVISLGAGVQSSVLALMAAQGEVGPMPDAAIFADTGYEPRQVYEHLRWLSGVLPFPVLTVTVGNIREDSVGGCNSTGRRFASMPFFLDDDGAPGMGRRQCTSEYKIKPVQRKIRELCGLAKGARAKGSLVEQWIGFSTDEFTRMSRSRFRWIVNRWPLLELDMSRNDCVEWFKSRYTERELVKSACIACPYRSDAEWRALTEQEFEDACEFDDAIRNHPKMNGKQYVHRSRKPLREVDFSTAEDHGQSALEFDDCQGMCGI